MAVAGTLSAVTERTLALIKPDGVGRQLVGEIIGRVERKGLTIAALELRNVGDELARAHYAEHDGKPFFCRGDHVGRPFTQIRFTSISHVPGGLATREPLQNII